MKIAYLSDANIPSAFANSVHVMRMCNAFAAEGHDVTLYCYMSQHSDGGAFRAYGLEPRFKLEYIRDVPIRGLRRGLRMAYIWRTTRRAPPVDLYYGRDIYGLVAIAQLGRPMILEAHTPPRSYEQERVVGWLLRRREFARLVVISTPLMHKYLSLYPNLDPASVLVAHDAADEQSVSGKQSLPSWPGRSGVLQLGYAGSLYKGKGADVVARLAVKMPHYDFHIVGGTQEEGAYLRQSFKSANLFYHGRVEHVLVAAYLSKLDITLFPGQSNVLLKDGTDIGSWTSPMKLFEYMASQKAIIASEVQSTREILEQYVNAILVPADDLGAWTQAIEQLASDPALRLTLATRAYSDWSRRFTWTQRAKSVVAGLTTLNLDGSGT